MPIGVTTAAIAGAGAIGGALIASSGAKSAAKTEAAAANNSTAVQQQEYNDTVAREQAASQNVTGVDATTLASNTSLNAPYLATGGSALDQLAGLYGLNTTDANGNVVQGAGSGAANNPNSTFYQSPDYNFTLAQGEKGIDAAAAAHGTLDSGATLKAEQAYGQNLASGQYNDYATRLQGLAGIGQQAVSNDQNANTNYASQYGNAISGAANATNAAGTNYANTVTNINTNAANNTANAQLSSANSTATALNSIVGQAQYALGKNPFASSYVGANATPTNGITPVTGAQGDGTGAGVFY